MSLLEVFDLYIGGRFVPPLSTQSFETVDPFTGKAWARVARADERDVDVAVRCAHEAFHAGPWSQMTATERGLRLHRLGDLALEHLDRLVIAESRDNGKSVSELRGAIRSMASWYHYFGGLADKIEGQVIPVDRADALNYTVREPYGVVAAILPWNSPLRIAAWKLAPALAAGNTVVLKPSEHTSTSILSFAELIELAGFPAGVINIVTGFGPEVVPPLVEHSLVNKISFTGGGVAARVIAELAARHFKSVTLELGGKSPQIVFDDADLQRAARGIAAGAFGSGGQTCVAGSRAIVHASVHDELVERVLAIADKVRLGDPSDPSTDVGPVATVEQYSYILERVEEARQAGARLLTGGLPNQSFGAGQFFPPTVFTDVSPDMKLFQEEVFGPVLAVTRFDTETDAIELANAVRYGLAAGVWTRDLARAHRVARRVQAGTIWVNGYRNTVPQSPFGGYKDSGLGRESGLESVKEYLQTKSIWIDLADELDVPFDG